MKYFITTLELAQGISAIKAQQMGCTGTTSFWWGIIQHPDTAEAALCIPQEEYTLTEEVKDEEGNIIIPAESFKVLYESLNFLITTNDLIDFDELDNEGWFPSSESEVQ